MWFLVFSINFVRTREGRPARRKLTELLVKSKKNLVTDPAAIFFLFFKSILRVRLRLLSFTSSMLHLVWSRERNDKTLTPTPTGIFLLSASDWEFCATGGRASPVFLKWKLVAAESTSLRGFNHVRSVIQSPCNCCLSPYTCEVVVWFHSHHVTYM